jgi:hypothetical protein
MKFNKKVYLNISNEHLHEIQSALIGRRPAALLFEIGDIGHGGNQILLSLAQVKRLQVALKSDASHIEITIPVCQLETEGTGFTNLITATTIYPKKPLAPVDPSVITFREAALEPNEELEELPTMEDLEIADDLTPISVRITASQKKKIATGQPININIAKESINATDDLTTILLNSDQCAALMSARKLGTGIRLKLDQNQVKKSLTS